MSGLFDKMMEKEKFMAYERVRESGVTNMFDVKTVEQLSGLSKSEIMDIMQNYGELKEKYIG
jgi:hypothetical protein